MAGGRFASSIICRGGGSDRDIAAVIANTQVAHYPTDARILPEGNQLAPGGTRTPTYKAYWTLGKEIDRFLREKQESGKTPKTIEDYREVLRPAAQRLYDAGMDLNPRRFTQDHINFLASSWANREDGTPNTHNYCVHNLQIVRGFVRYCGHKSADKLRIAPKTQDRPHARWLTKAQAQALVREAQGVERMIVHLELRIGMRRIETLRITPRDFRGGLSPEVRILGKGNKVREVPWAGDTAPELGYWMTLRDARIAEVRAVDPDASVPESLLLYAGHGRLSAYSESGVDAIIERAGRRVGIARLSNHDLRRTYGRLVYFANGRRIGDLVELMGHETEEQTRRYLGLGADHLRETTAKTDAYMKTVEIPEDGISGDSQTCGGPNRIRADSNDWLVVENSNPRNLPRSLM